MQGRVGKRGEQMAGSTRARAATLVAPGRYELREYPLPEPAPGCALVRMRLSGICGTDKHTYQGYTTQYAGTGALLPFSASSSRFASGKASATSRYVSSSTTICPSRALDVSRAATLVTLPTAAKSL